MNALSNAPLNMNYLSLNNIGFTIKKAPNISFFCQEANIPGISIPPTQTSNPFVRLPVYGDHIDFEDLVIKFPIDEMMLNYMEIHSWLRGLGFASTWDEFAALKNARPVSGQGLESDIEITIFDSVKNARFSVTYQDAFPTNLSGINFSSTNKDAVYGYATATFRYKLYDIKSLI